MGASGRQTSPEWSTCDCGREEFVRCCWTRNATG